MKGFLLAVQFFTIFPIHKQLPMTKKHITTMFLVLPFVGAMMGLVVSAVYYLLQTYTDISALLTAFLLFFVFVLLTGGLHLDGFVDTGDAFFSYRSIEKRHEILDDPRIGAFGAMALVFLVIGKIIFLHELIVDDLLDYYWLLFIPFLSRVGMSFYLVQTPASKEKGMGAFFKSHIYLKLFIALMSLFLVIGLVGVSWWSGDWVMPAILVVTTVVASRLYHYWTLKNFNGSSGDLYGAFIEGLELVLWIALLLFL